MVTIFFLKKSSCKIRKISLNIVHYQIINEFLYHKLTYNIHCKTYLILFSVKIQQFKGLDFTFYSLFSYSKHENKYFMLIQIDCHFHIVEYKIESILLMLDYDLFSISSDVVYSNDSPVWCQNNVSMFKSIYFSMPKFGGSLFSPPNNKNLPQYIFMI